MIEYLRYYYVLCTKPRYLSGTPFPAWLDLGNTSEGTRHDRYGICPKLWSTRTKQSTMTE
jgi:hypothetical protein